MAMMSSSPTSKNIANDIYHAAVVGGLALGYAKIGQMVFKGPMPRLDTSWCWDGRLGPLRSYGDQGHAY